jgi:aspartate aminotransferase-like enzyme
MSQQAARSRRPGNCQPQHRKLTFKVASTAAEFEAIHRLNHATFALEIPQHAPNALGRLVDRYHTDNVYVVCLSGGTVVGMVAGRCSRPFSLDQKLRDLDTYLPPHRKAVEIRLLAVAPGYRHSAVFAGLVRMISRHFVDKQCDLALISGTVRQLKLYRHLGFRPFASPVGTEDALYQPMFLTLEALECTDLFRPAGTRAGRAANFLPGPVAIEPEVLAAAAARPISHREPAFIEQLLRVRSRLAQLVRAPHAVLLLGTGTLGNDVVAAQLRCMDGHGAVLSNGEFGERLIDHARRWNLQFSALRYDWGMPFDWPQLQTTLERIRPRWVWAVLCETSTGIQNSQERLLASCASVGADLCLDAVSAVGLFPVNLAGIRLATAVSGKGLAALPGLVAVFHDGRVAPAGQVPRYLDIADYESADGVPFTHSSNLVSSLDRSLSATRWADKFERIARDSLELRANLRKLGLVVVAPEADAAPGIVTVALPTGTDSQQVATALAAEGIQISWRSAYLQRRNWIQLCLMGAYDDIALRRVRRLLARALVRGAGASGVARHYDRSQRSPDLGTT